MRKRVAAKVISRAQDEDGPDYRKRTLDRAVDKLWATVPHGRWHGTGSRRRTREGAVRPAGW